MKQTSPQAFQHARRAPAPAGPAAAFPDAAALPRHQARSLTGGGARAMIELDGQLYVLRITRAGKLILTK